ncbi:MAG: M23 family metallopeptidase [Chloroflexota bacterium]|nr:M23 family metallopeptidase [Chloroflexota bacterium]
MSNAFPRALFTAVCVLALGIGLGGQAVADDPTPRAVPQARALVRTFSSYDALVAYATTIAADQTALDARASTVRLERDGLRADLTASGANSRRGGRLFDPDGQRRAPSHIVSTTSRVADLTAIDDHLTTLGALTAPVTTWTLPTEGMITQGFGPTSLWVEPARTYEGVAYGHFHEGVDLAGAWAADVVAPARGRVVFVGRMLDGAEVVVLAHDGGIVTLYAHLDAYNNPPTVNAGDEVTAGRKIGTVGRTGIVTGLHLHWAAWRNGELIDPLSLVGH